MKKSLLKRLLRELMIMSRFVFFIICVQAFSASFLIASDGNAQSKSIYDIGLNLRFNETPILDAFQKIERNTDFKFSFNTETLDRDLRVSFKGRASIGEVLEDISKQTSLLFRRVDYSIHVYKANERLHAGIEEVVNKIDQNTITGMITDENGEGLPGASIIIKGTNNGTTTDISGNYKLNVTDDAVLVVSFVGYMIQEIPVAGRTTIDLKMEPDTESLDEVVVIGYGSVKRSDLTGAVASISKKDLQNTTSNSISTVLQGRAAGVAVITGDAAPGGGINIRIRGTSSINSSTEPLYIVDGFPVNSSNDDLYVGGGFNESPSSKKVRPNALSFLNPQDIESIEILKDAAATTIYGSRGANGVVLIKTKRGQAGQSNVDVNYSGGLQSIIKTYERPTGQQYAEQVNEGQVNGGGSPRFDGSSIYFPTPANANTTDWQDLMYRVAPIHNLGLTVSGGAEKTQFLLSGKYFHQEGIMIENSFNDIQTRMNIDHTANDIIKIGSSVLLSRSENHQVPAGSVFNNNIVTQILGQSPVHDPSWIDETTGRWWTDPNVLYQTTDPYNYVTSTRDIRTTNRILANGYIDINFAKDFNFHTTTGIDRTDVERDLYYPRTMQNSGSAVNNGSATLNRTILERTMVNAYVSYNKQLGDHNLSAVVGTEAIQQVTSYRNMHSENFTSDAQTTYNMGEGLSNIGVGSGQSKWQNLGYFGRVNFNISNKYLLSGNFRYDGASQFGADNKWAFFPSMAAAWKINEESFFPDQEAVSSVKLRLSVGQTGNGFIPAYSSLGTWSISGRRYSYNNQLVAGSRLTRMDNPELKWETTTQYNLGLDLGLFSDRLTFNLDLYKKVTNDLILNIVIPRSSGFGSSTQNIGSLENKGVELTMNWVVVDKAFKYDLSINGSHNKSKMLDLNIEDEESEDSYLEVASWERYGGIRLYEGQPAGEIYGFVIDGVFEDQAAADAAATQPGGNLPGYYNYRDTNDDGVINSDDMVSLGNGQPDLFVGMNHSFSYRNFDLSVFFQGAFGNQIVVFYGTDDFSDALANTWTASDPVNKKYGVNSASGNGYQGLRIDSYMVHNADYFRLKNMTLGYNFPVAGLKWTDGIRLYFTTENMLTFTKYPGYNPDVSSGGTYAFGEGFDGGVYPLAKTYVFGVNLKF